MVRAKCRCSRITDHGSSREVFLHPVQNTSDDNKSWSQWTPDGEIRLKITNPAAFEQFKVNELYYVDFNVIVPEPTAQGK